MRSLRTWIDPGGRWLDRRLEELRLTLESLGARLRERVATVIGETLGTVARDTLLQTLANLNDYHPEPVHSRPRTWDDSRWYADQRDEFEPWFDDQDDYDRPQDNCAEQSSPTRLTLAWTTALHGIAWCLGRRAERPRVIPLLAIGLLAGCVAYTMPTLAMVGLGLIGSAGQLGYLTDAIRAFGAG